jgi:hypothetical protein
MVNRDTKMKCLITNDEINSKAWPFLSVGEEMER